MMRFALLLWLGIPATTNGVAPVDRWVPARWEGGPIEVARRARGPRPPAEDPGLLKALAEWYNPSTLSLLDGTPVNCLLVTFSAEVDPDIEKRQHGLVQSYAKMARERGIAVLGIVHPGRDPIPIAEAAVEARLDGLVLEARFPDSALFAAKLRAALRAKNSAAVVIPIEQDSAPARRSVTMLPALEGVRPSARDLADMGIRAGPSAEPWIESNIWLVRSFRFGKGRRPVWISQEPNPGSPGDYGRSVADASVAGGHWIVSLDDQLKAGLYRKEPDALAVWRSVSGYLRFAEDNDEWRNFTPYGNLAIVLDTEGDNSEFAHEYLNLVARRQIPYRILLRSELNPASLAGFRAVLAADMARPSVAERATLQNFAEKGGLVIAGAWWGNAPSDADYASAAAGKGQIVTYKDDPPDPETVARDMLDLLEPEMTGLAAFNVPSVLTYVSTGDSGKRALVQLLNYATTPFKSKITIRLKGVFQRARLHTPENAPADLTVRPMPNDWTEFSVPMLAVWGAVFLD
jgi:hypothetical protein